MDVVTTIRRPPTVLSADPLVRAAMLRARIGTNVRLTSGDFSLDGLLVTVVAPAMHSENPAPVVVIDTGMERVAGPVLAGDILA